MLNGRLQTAAEQDGAHEVAEELSKGYETVLGRCFESGVDLSGGHWLDDFAAKQAEAGRKDAETRAAAFKPDTAKTGS